MPLKNPENPAEKFNILKCPMMQSGHHPDFSMASYELTKGVIKMLLYPTSGLFSMFAFGCWTMFPVLPQTQSVGWDLYSNLNTANYLVKLLEW